MMLFTERLVLRNYEPTDFERVHYYGSQPNFSKYEEWGPNSEEDTEKFIAAKIAESISNPRYIFDLAVCLKDQNLQIGGCGIRRDGKSSSVANLGWAMNPDYQNLGYTTEAARRLIEFGFNELNVLVIYATCDTRNGASYKVMEKLGMKRVGFIKEHKFIKGHLRDSYRYEILKADFKI